MPTKNDSEVAAAKRETSWTFLSNHAHVLLCISSQENIRLRDVAAHVGITERAVQRIVADLEQGGYLSRSKNGRRNHYELHPDQQLGHPREAHRQLGDILSLAEGSLYQTQPPSADGYRRPSRRLRQPQG